ncbi:hypothetical protein ACFWDA_26150 [Rhodococcus zopfii]|uniref:hypothetical protein n=1 Tax=Rhodococcus zopfii TaxID=43772 RepID=UPI00366358D7
MTNPQFSYNAIAVQQQPNAPTMYVLGIEAAELLQWADVPSAKADYMAGYQRVYSEERARAISDFLAQSPNNITPGAIIVTVAADSIEVLKDGESGIAQIRISAMERSFEDRLQSIYESFLDRLSPAEKQSVKLEVDPAAIVAEVDEEEGIPESYLATLTAELAAAINDWDALPSDRRTAISNFVNSVSKPGLIIDGQHRVYGAKDVIQNSIQLPVVLLPGLDYSEQVFHFYVLNNKAKPLSPTELRRTISTSLTNSEIDKLWERFDGAGINPEATRWTHKMHTDPNSPFRDLIDFGLGGGGFLKENVAFQVVSRFVNMNRKYRLLYKDIPAFEQKSDDRLQYFYAFWSGIRARYENVWNQGVSQGGNQLFQKAGLLVLQEFALDQLVQYANMANQMHGSSSPFVHLDSLGSAVESLLQFLPPDFFLTEWQEKQIDTSNGRAFLRQQMMLTYQNQGKFFRNQQLFKKS